MSNVPTNLIPTRITGLPEYTGTSTLGYMAYVLDGRTYKVQFSNIAAVGAVPSSRVIGTGNGLEGGGDLSQNRVISIIPHGVGYSQLDFTGVTAGTYGSADTIPSLTIDATGRVTAAVNTPVVLSNYVPSSRTVTAGAGLTGGGQLNSNITIALNPSNATPQSLGVAFAGTGTQAARDDHVHPAVDLTDTSETQGVLPLGRGGTGVALSPVVGAVIYADNDSLNQTIAGNVGQVLTSAGGLGAPYWQTITGTGTVTSVSVNTANGFAGTVTDPNINPALTLRTTVTGVIKGDGTAISAATPAVDYVAPGAVTTSGLTMATDRLLGRTTASTGAVEAITVGSGLSLSGGSLTNSAPDQVVSLTGGTAISISGTYPAFTVTNTAPDQIVSLTGAGTTVVTGTYPSFTITSNDQYVGTVTSVAASGGTTGLTFSGTPITTSGTLTLSGTLAVANGGTGATVMGTARTNLGAAASGANTDITSIALTTGTISATPTSGTDIVNKLYADSIASGINFHQSVRLATAAALPANTYNNGASGVGATLTANANGALSVDGVAVVAGNRILVKNEVTQANNGVYTVTQVGSAGAPYILTRATDFDSSGAGVDQIDAGDFFLVTSGSTQSNTSWVQQTPLPITVGTTAIVFTQFAAPVLYSAGTGLTLAGTVFSITNTGVTANTYGSASSVPVIAVNAQGQVTSASSTAIAIAASQITSGVLPVANGGTGQSSYTNGQLLIGNTTGNTLTKATLTAGTNISITNGAGAITINATDQFVGTVTSVSGTGTVSGLTLTGTVTTSGNLTLGGTLAVTPSNFAGQLANTFLAAPNGIYGTPTFRTIVAADVPTLNQNTTGTASNVTGIVAVANGGTGVTSSTGTGSVVLSNSPTLVTPTLGAASATSIANGLGAVGTPSYAFTGDLNTGMWSPGVDTVAFSTNGAERMRITDTGFVGIGTSAPSSSQILTLNSGGTATPANGGLAGVAISNTDVTASGTSGILGNLTDPGGTGRHAGAIAFGKDGTWTTGSAYPGNIQFWTRPNSTASEVERMRIDSSGNVGIGTAAPAVKLDVNGSANFGAAITTGVGVSTGDAVIEVGGSRSGDGPAYVDLHAVAGTDFEARVIRFGGTNGIMEINNSGTGGMLLNNTGAAAMAFQTTATERMRITSGGNVGIGTTTPGKRLELNAVGANAAIRLKETASYGVNWDIDVGSSNAMTFNNNAGSVLSYVFLKGDLQVSRGATGVAADAAINFGSNSNNYIFGGNANNLMAFATNGSERMRIDSSGNVMVGTSSPSGRFTVQATDGNIAFFDSTDTAGGLKGVAIRSIATSGTATPFLALRQWRSSFAGNFDVAQIRFDGLTTTGGYAEFASIYASAGTNTASGAPTSLVFNTMNTSFVAGERMRISANGEVGIGTSSPASLLHVKRGSNATEVYPTGTWATRVINATDAAGENGLLVGNRWAATNSTVFEVGSIFGGGTGSWRSFYRVDGVGNSIWSNEGTERMRLATDGTVGMGVSTPNASLHIQGIRGGNGRMTQSSTGGTSQNNLNIIASSSAGGADQWYSYGVTASNYFFLQTGVGTGDSGLVVNSNNRVMVGTSTAFDTTVGANFMASGSAGSAAAFRVNATTTTQVSFYDSSQTARVGWIGTSGSSTSYNTTSDRRLKKNIQPVGDVGAKIDQIEVVSHEWTNGTDTVIPYAFIAQDLYEAAPHAVSKGDDGDEVGLEWAVDYSKLVPMLVKEVQSLRARVAQLEGK